MMVNTIITKILSEKRKKWEFPIALVSFLMGLLLFLLALQFNGDMNHIFKTQLRRGQQLDYLLINKKLGQKKMMVFEEPQFDENEIKQIESLPWVNKVGKVISNMFPVRAEISLFGRGFQTELFFESMDNEFLDIIPEGWNWNTESIYVPIIISRDFLVLYNFGFAGGRNFPYISEDMLHSVPVKLTIRNKEGKNIYYDAAIVGLSDRISSVLLPFSFLNYANKKYATEKPIASRLILSVNDRTNPEVSSFLNEKAYETNRDKLRLSDAGGIIQIVLSVLSAFGLILLILSFIIIFLTYRMMLVKNKNDIAQLLELGFYPKEIIFTILFPISIGITIVMVLSLLVFILLASVTHNIMGDFGIQNLGIEWFILIIGALISIALLVFQFFLLNRVIYKISFNDL